MLPAAAPYEELCTFPADGRGKSSSQHCFVICIVDHCISLLAGAPRYQLDRLQSMLNTEAGAITRWRQEARPHQTRAAQLSSTLVPGHSP